jgi:hypothetical protein
MAKEQKTDSENVSFRLSGRHQTKLKQYATRTGFSRHQQAQKMVEAALDGREEELMLMRVEVADLRAEVEAMRGGLAKILTGLVASSSSGRMPLEEARNFVKQAFARKGVPGKK